MADRIALGKTHCLRGVWDGKGLNVLWGLGASGRAGHVLCSLKSQGTCSTWEGVKTREVSPSFACILLKLVVNCLLNYPLHRQKDDWRLFLCEVSGIISTTKKHFYCMAWRSQLQGHLQCIPLRAGLPLQGSAEPTRSPEHQATRGQRLLPRLNITTYSLANIILETSETKPQLHSCSEVPRVSCVQVNPPCLTNVQSLKIGFWWWIQGLCAF